MVITKEKCREIFLWICSRWVGINLTELEAQEPEASQETPLERALPPRPPFSEQPWVLYTMVTIQVCIFLFLAPSWKYTINWHHEQVGLNGFMVFSGQWWRFFSYAFFHASIVHLISNVIFIIYYGRKVEKVCGHLAFLVFCITAAVVPDLLIYIWPIGDSIGASAIVFGLFGIYLGLLHARLIPYEKNWKTWLPLAIFILYFFPYIPKIADLAHLIALVYGLAMVHAYTLLREKYLNKYWRLFVPINVALMALVMAPSLLFPNPTKEWSKALSSQQNGDYAEAIKGYSTIINAIPSYGFAYLHRASCFDDLGKSDLAYQDYLTATKNDPNNPYVFATMGDYLLDKAKVIEAWKNFQEAVRLGLDEGNTCLIYGKYYVEKGQYKEAVNYLSQAAALKTNLGAVLCERGLAYFFMNDDRHAEMDWRQAADCAKNQRSSAGYLNYINYIYVREQRWQEVIDLANKTKAMQLSPRNEKITELFLRMAYDQIGQKYASHTGNGYWLDQNDVRRLRRRLPQKLWPYFAVEKL